MVKASLKAGWLSSARHCESPNQDQRPKNTEIDAIVIHGISLPPGQFGGPYIEEFFGNRLDSKAHPYFKEINALTVSAHFLIRRDGEIVQFVSTLERAWHAGTSELCGRTACNDFSIGIELEGCDDVAYTDEQYASLANLIGKLVDEYPKIHRERIVGHSEIAPGRKTDPGPAFDWSKLDKLLIASNLRMTARG